MTLTYRYLLHTWQCPRLLFQKFLVVFLPIDAINSLHVQNLKFVDLPVPEIIGAPKKFGQSQWILGGYHPWLRLWDQLNMARFLLNLCRLACGPWLPTLVCPVCAVLLLFFRMTSQAESNNLKTLSDVCSDPVSDRPSFWRSFVMSFSMQSYDLNNRLRYNTADLRRVK